MTQFSKINTIYEDTNLLVIDKPAGLVVHPGAANEKNTLVDWLKDKYPEVKKYSWPDASRPGIVHRLDKDTSGLMILAKNPETLEKLQKQFQEHKITKKYLTLVLGKLDKKEGEITSLVGRDPDAPRQQVSRSIFFDFEPGKKREAKTYYKVLKEYHYRDNILTLIEATLDTGRTHQIRVQFKALGHPVIGDPIYNIKHSKKISKKLGLNRQFLHAYKLEFGQHVNHQFESNLPKDLSKIINVIE